MKQFNVILIPTHLTRQLLECELVNVMIAGNCIGNRVYHYVRPVCTFRFTATNKVEIMLNESIKKTMYLS